jgi:hypothetical protein
VEDARGARSPPGFRCSPPSKAGTASRGWQRNGTEEAFCLSPSSTFAGRLPVVIASEGAEQRSLAVGARSAHLF